MNLSLPLRHPIMCLTQDRADATHEQQAEQLCAAGARWIQLRMKRAAHDTWLATARRVVEICHAHGALCIVNDSVLIALAAKADGAHLGGADMDWRHARRMAGPRLFLGGTINNDADAERALACGCLDYAGIGPFRFTDTKEKLAPVLGADGIARLASKVAPLPAWAIGGITPTDLSPLRAAGLAGAAVCSAFHQPPSIAHNFRAFAEAWSASHTLS